MKYVKKIILFNVYIKMPKISSKRLNKKQLRSKKDQCKIYDRVHWYNNNHFVG